MKPIFEIDNWGNQYAEGVEYRFLWGLLRFEYELSSNRSFDPSYLQQYGGGQVYLSSISLFGRTLSFTVIPY